MTDKIELGICPVCPAPEGMKGRVYFEDDHFGCYKNEGCARIAQLPEHFPEYKIK
jgi:hypothetical protein